MKDPQKQAASFFEAMESEGCDIMDMAVTIRHMTNLVSSKAETDAYGQQLEAKEHVRIPFDA